MIRIRFLSLIILVHLLYGCTPNFTHTIKDANYPVPIQQDTYDPGYPINTSTLETIFTPTVVPNTGFIYGIIKYNGKALPQTTFFLAEVLINEQGQEIATSLDRTTAPMSVTDSKGLLEFYNVNPGYYGLVLAEGMNTYLLLYPDSGEAILITVLGGDNIDLGSVNFTDLPLD